MLKKLLLLTPAIALAFASIAPAADKVDFAKQIRPIFAETCYKCHAGSKHKGDLKLDSVESFLKGGKDGKVLTPGDAEKSDLFHRISLPADDEDIMPPKGGPLKKEQQDLVKQWIAEGASFGDWKADAVVAEAPKTNPSGDTASASSDPSEAPKEIPLPQVPPADQGALDKLRNAGAQVLPLAIGTNLLSVEFTSNASQITNEQVALLAGIAPQAYELNLAGTKVTDDGLKALEGMKNLHRLHLEKTAVTDAGLVHLKDLGGLEYLNLYGTAVTDDGLAQITPLKDLKRLYLWQSKVTDSGADTLKKAIPAVTVDLGWKEPKKEEPKKEEPKKEEPKKDDAKAEPKKEEVKKEDVKKEEPKKDDAKKEDEKK